MNLKNFFKRKISERDSWLRLGVVDGGNPKTSMKEWDNTIKLLDSNTNMKRSDILEYIIQMKIIGVNNKDLIGYLGICMDKVGFVSFNGFGVFGVVRRIIATGYLGKRQLHTLGLSEDDLINGMGMSLDELNNKFKVMDSNQRAGILALLINQKYH